MSKLQLLSVFLNNRLTAAAVEIFGAVEKTVVEYQDENDRLRRVLRITPEIELCRIDSLQLSLAVPHQQLHCEQGWSPRLGQEDPEPTQIKEEQAELRTSQEEEQLQGLEADIIEFIFTPPCVKSECDLEDPLQEAKLAENPTLSQLKMCKLHLFRTFLNERLMASAAVEISGAFEKTVAEYQKENDWLRRLLRITPEIKLCRIDSLHLSLAVSEEEVPPEKQHCEQEWSPSLGQEDPEPTQIKEEQEELRTSQEKEQLQGLTPLCVKSECDQEDPLWSLTLPQIQTVAHRENDPKPVDLTPFGTVTHLKGFDIPCVPPDNPNNAYSHSSAVSSEPVGLDSRPPLDPNPTSDLNQSMCKHGSKPSIMSRKTHRCCDCGETFPLKADHQRHVTLAKKRLSECCFCKNRYNSNCKLKAHVQLCHGGKSCTCPVCGKTIKYKGDLSRHMRIHKGEKPFSCGDCGKSFSLKGNLIRHKLTHTGEKPFSCGDCGKSFSLKNNLTMHKLTHTKDKPFTCNVCDKSFRHKKTLTEHIQTHTREKLFSCGDCRKSFNRKETLTRHKLTHTGEKSFSCGDCGKSFSLKNNLIKHKVTHTGEKPFSCGDCGKSFNQKGHLNVHILTHTGVKPFNCGDCGKSFKQKVHLNLHILAHTGEKPFSCNVCGKTFRYKGTLTKHIQTHTGEKLFNCGDCGKSFIQKWNLIEHIRTHTGEKRFSCGDCGKSFSRKQTLTDHILTHTGEKQHGCSVCGKSFTHKTNLLRHVDKIHKEIYQEKNE